MIRSHYIHNKNHLMEALIDSAFFYGFMIASPHSYQAKSLVQTGDEWPKDVKPGALILSLSPEHRAMLQELTPEDLNHRLDSIPFLRRR